MKIKTLTAVFTIFGLLAATDLTAQVTTGNLLTNPGAEDGLVGWTTGGNSNPAVDNGSFDPGINPHSGSFSFVGGNGDIGSLSQTVTLQSLPDISIAEIDNGLVAANISFWAQGLDQGAVSDSSRITLTFFDGASLALGTGSTPEIDSHNLTWANDSESFSVPVGTRSIAYTMEFIRHAGSDLGKR